jgi:hypothetical protein
MHSLHNILSYSPLGKIMIFTPQTVMRIINYIYKNNKGRRGVRGICGQNRNMHIQYLYIYI